MINRIGTISYIVHFKDDLKLQKNNLDNKTIEETSTAIKNTFNNLFEGLSTEHKQTNFYKEHGNFVEPIGIKVDGKKLGFFVPFKEKLQTILAIPELNVYNRQPSNQLLSSKNIYSEITQGEYVKNLIENKKSKNKYENSLNEEEILTFAMYYDDIEVVNAIGNSRKKHKLGYYFLRKKLLKRFFILVLLFYYLFDLIT